MPQIHMGGMLFDRSAGKGIKRRYIPPPMIISFLDKVGVPNNSESNVLCHFIYIYIYRLLRKRMILQIGSLRIQSSRLFNLASHVLSPFVPISLVLTVICLMEQFFSILIHKVNVPPVILISGEFTGTETCSHSWLTTMPLTAPSHHFCTCLHLSKVFQL